MVPKNLRYTKDHEWVALEGETGTVGITAFAQEQLGDIVYVELPEIGKQVAAGDILGTIESVKAVSEVYAPVAGTVTEVNAALGDASDLVNKDPYGQGWICRIRLASAGEAASLLDPAAYEGLLSAAK